jgi:hypothetical protein
MAAALNCSMLDNCKMCPQMQFFACEIEAKSAIRQLSDGNSMEIDVSWVSKKWTQMDTSLWTEWTYAQQMAASPTGHTKSSNAVHFHPFRHLSLRAFCLRLKK